MTNKASFCASLRLTRTVSTRLQLKVRPKGLHNFAFYILIFAFSLTSYGISSTIDNVRKNKLFMQNKANFRKVKFNVNRVLTRGYDQMDTWSIRKTKPIQSQFKPNQSQLKPIQSQLKPKQSQSKPIQSQSKPIKCQNKPNSNPNKANFSFL